MRTGWGWPRDARASDPGALVSPWLDARKSRNTPMLQLRSQQKAPVSSKQKGVTATHVSSGVPRLWYAPEAVTSFFDADFLRSLGCSESGSPFLGALEKGRSCEGYRCTALAGSEG